VAHENKTEKPTPKRRRQARLEGRVAKSTEISSALVLLAVGGALTIFGPSIFRGMEQMLREGIARAADPHQAGAEAMTGITTWALRAIALSCGPIVLAAALVGVAANVGQVGFRFTPLALKPSLAKLNPMKMLKRTLGGDGLVEALKAIAKTSVVGLVAFFAVWPKLPEIASLTGLPPGAILPELAGLIRDMFIKVGGAFLLLAGADYAWKRRKHEHSLRMTRSELKREVRQMELPNEVRRAIRQRQAQMARRRMIADVETADVVVANPTHFAVALRYTGELPAPEVIAKGADLVAAAIRKKAEEHGVPIVQMPELARALYREVKVGQMIPEEFFVAVAEVLAFVYRTAKRRPRLKIRRRTPISGAHAVPSSRRIDPSLGGI
jgi:flagellar biosynthetic protein FlhB